MTPPHPIPHPRDEDALSRRDLLAGAIGLPAAWAIAGCGGETPSALTGEILGASAGLGHRIRDGFRPRPPDGSWQDVDVVIVGAGIAGLSAVWRLRRAGFENFQILELESRSGGTSRAGEMSGLPCPWGAHYIPTPLASNRALVALLEEMQALDGKDADGEPIVREEILCRDPEERLFIDGAWREGLSALDLESPDDQRQWKEFQSEVQRWAAWKDSQGRRAFTIPSADCSDDPEVMTLDRQSMLDWLTQRNLTSPRLQWMVEYACRDDYGMTLAQTSAWAGLFYFASRIHRAGDDAQPLMTWPDGNGRFVAHLSNPVRDRLLSGMAVTEIYEDPTNSGGPVHVVALGGDGTSVAGYRAKQVIFCAPQFLAPYLIRGYRDARGADAAEFQYGSWLVANLHLRNRPAEHAFPLAWDNVLYDSQSLGYVVATHQSGRDHGPTVFTYYLPLCGDDPRAAREKLLSLKWEDCAELVLSDLETAHPDIRRLVTRLDVVRWGHAMIRPRPGFRSSDARRSAAKPFGAIHFAHSDLSGLALFEEAFNHGLRAAEEVLAARGVDSESLLTPPRGAS